MVTYTLKWISSYYYNLYDSTGTIVSDADAATLFSVAGSAFFIFDFNGGSPTVLDRVYIRDEANSSNIITVLLSGKNIAEDYLFIGTWSASATVFDTFQRSMLALNEEQLGFLMHQIKIAGDTQTGASAPTTATSGKLGNFYLDTTNDDLYYLSAITPQGTTPETYTYTWETVGGGGGGIQNALIIREWS